MKVFKVHDLKNYNQEVCSNPPCALKGLAPVEHRQTLGSKGGQEGLVTA